MKYYGDPEKGKHYKCANCGKVRMLDLSQHKAWLCECGKANLGKNTEVNMGEQNGGIIDFFKDIMK